MITGFEHVAVLVKDLDLAIEQYKAIFGTDKLRVGAVRPGHRGVRIDFGDGNNIELMEPTDETGPWGRHHAKYGDGIYLFALRVDDLEKTVGEMRARGVNLPPPVGGNVVIHPKSAGGALIKLVER